MRDGDDGLSVSIMGVCDKPVLLSLPAEATVVQMRDQLWRACGVPPLEQQYFRGDVLLADDELVSKHGVCSVTIDFRRLSLLSDQSSGQKLLLQAKANDVAGVEHSLRRPVDPDYCDPADRCTALHAAAMCGHIDVLQFLLWPGKADKDRTMKGGKTPLHCAVESEHREAARFLCHAGVDWNLQMDDGQSVLHLVARLGDLTMLKAVDRVGLDKNAEMELKWTPTHVAAFHGHVEVVRKFHEMAASVDLPAADGRRPLHIAAEKGYLDICQTLFECKADLNARTNNGYTVLHSAVLSSNADLCGWIIEEVGEKGMFVLAGENGTALHIAAALGYLQVVSLWCIAGINTDFEMADGVTALHVAVVNNRIDVAKQLCQSKGGSRDYSRSDGASPIYLATERKHAEMMKMLIALEVDVSKRTTYELVSPLMISVQVDFLEGFRLLLEAKADLDDVSRDVGTAMYMASESNRIEMVRALCVAGADKEVAGFLERRPLHAAADSGFLEVVRLLLDEGAGINAGMRGNWTSLHLAAHKGHFEVVQLLCARDANLAIEIVPGMTALCCAANSGHEDVARLLISQGADLEVPIKMAVDGDYLELAHFLNSLRPPDSPQGGPLKSSLGGLRGPDWSMSPKSSQYAMTVNRYLEKEFVDA